MQGWYKTVYNHPLTPACIKLAHITTDRAELYRQVPPHVDRISIEAEPFFIDDSIPSMYNIKWVVHHLQRH